MEPIVTILAGGPGEGWDGPWWIFPPLFFFIWLTFAAVVVWLATRWWPRRWRDDGGFEAASGVLAERFARGEISNDEYTERLSQLRRAFGDRKENAR